MPDTELDIPALTALCEAHPDPYELTMDWDSDGDDIYAHSWEYATGISQGVWSLNFSDGAYPPDTPTLQALIDKANACASLLARLAAAERVVELVRWARDAVVNYDAAIVG